MPTDIDDLMQRMAACIDIAIDIITDHDDRNDERIPDWNAIADQLVTEHRDYTRLQPVALKLRPRKPPP